MRSAISYRPTGREPSRFMPSMTVLAVASFIAGFAGYMVFGLGFVG